MTGAATVAILGGFALWVVFVAVNISVAIEIADGKNRRAGAWAVFAFLFPLAGPFLVWMLPPRRK